MYLNDKEEKIIGQFVNVADDLEGQLLILNWKDGSQAHGIYDSYIEDELDCDMDDESYEEFWSFVFKAVDITQLHNIKKTSMFSFKLKTSVFLLSAEIYLRRKLV